MAKRISTEATPENIASALDMLASVPDQLAELRELLPPEKLEQPIAADERSPRRVLVHLLNCEARASDAIYSALLLRTPLVPRIHPERDWGKLMRYEQFNYDDLLDYFRFRRQVLLGVLRGLNEKGWARDIQEKGKQRRESVYLLARGTALHEMEHIQDIKRKLALSPN
ncbi:MAG: DinB family protein [Chloroflexi bacterium]|nr:DinB family protein [Chloroflexota bacterium]